MKILSVLGARPQFIKYSPISREILHNNIKEVLVHTGQHFDRNMSDIFFKQMQMTKPNYNLNINCLTHGAMTGQMLEKIEGVLLNENPDWVLVLGDTNSTLAGALAAKKLNIKIAHIEAGLRSFNIKMPEEINRILTDRISDILFCPTDKAVENLKNEGFNHFNCKIVKSGDVMFDAALTYSNFAKRPDLQIPPKFVLSTIHRAENTNNIKRLKSITNALNKIAKEIAIILPLHPRTRKILVSNNIRLDFKVIEPIGYLEMLYLLKHCSLVMTDSGGLQKEAFFFKKPCITLRDETEWGELVSYGFNLLVGSNEEYIYKGYKKMINCKLNFDVNLYGNGNASKIIIRELLK